MVVVVLVVVTLGLGGLVDTAEGTRVLRIERLEGRLFEVLETVLTST